MQGGFERKPTSSGSVKRVDGSRVASLQSGNRQQQRLSSTPPVVVISDESIGAEPAGETTADERPTLHVLLSYDSLVCLLIHVT